MNKRIIFAIMMLIMIFIPSICFASGFDYMSMILSYSLGLDENTFNIIRIVILLSFILVVYVIWRTCGKDDTPIETVEFYPPEGFNPVEIRFLYDGVVNRKSVMSLLIYLANKGYLKIEKIKGSGLSGNSFRFTKLKEYDGNNEIEKTFFDGLFLNATYKSQNIHKAREIMNEAGINGNEVNFEQAMEKSKEEETIKRKTVTKADLYIDFYKVLEKIYEKVNTHENREKIFKTTVSSDDKWILAMLYITCILGAGIIPMIGVGGIWNILSLEKDKIEDNFYKWEYLIFGGALIVFPLLYKLFSGYLFSVNGMICIFANITLCILLFFLSIMPKRTEYGSEILGKIKGFIRFLKVAKKEEIEDLARKNGEYYYDILPYIYALGISNVYLEQFELTLFRAPKWYSDDDLSGEFELHQFNKFIDNTMQEISEKN